MKKSGNKHFKNTLRRFKVGGAVAVNYGKQMVLASVRDGSHELKDTLASPPVPFYIQPK